MVHGSVWGCLAAALINSGIHRYQSETEELWQKREKKRLRRSGNHKQGRNRQEQGENAVRGGKKKKVTVKEQE